MGVGHGPKPATPIGLTAGHNGGDEKRGTLSSVH
jgi:hypothetical protein